MVAMAAAGRDDPLILGVNGSKPLAWCEAKIGTEIQHKPQGHWSAGAGPAGHHRVVAEEETRDRLVPGQRIGHPSGVPGAIPGPLDRSIHG
jgi:hypothetical protein